MYWGPDNSLPPLLAGKRLGEKDKAEHRVR